MALTAADAGRFSIGGDRSVSRLGFGAMRIVGEGVWGPPADRAGALAVLRRLPELGVDLVDTADSYGPFISEELIAEALHPYDGLTVATKAGLLRTGPGEWHALGRPEYLRQCCEMSLRRLRVDRLDLFQLHRIDPQVPSAEQFGVLADLQTEGKVAHLGLSEVTVDDIEAAGEVFEVTTVQNRYNLADRAAHEVLEHCERNGIGFIPWFPLAAGELADGDGPLAEVADAHGASTGQIALAWLLRRSAVMLPIPGTGSIEHLEQNVAAAAIQLDDDQYERLTALAN